ncbi:hypothetical protein BDV19DRAFT_385499 [Aspergillus venezuelensis]
MDPFNQLPPELIAQILIYTASFSAVESAISASPRVHAISQAQPTMLRDLILSDPMTRLPEIQNMCYNLSLIQTNSVEFTSLAEYQQHFQIGPPAIEYTKELSTFMLHLTARTQRLACACLSLIQQNLVSALDGIAAGNIPAPTRISIAREQFSFKEEYQVYSSLWHLQHYSFLHEAANDRWNWDEPSMNGLDAYNEWIDTDFQRAEKIWTAAALLSDLGVRPVKYSHYPFQSEKRYLPQDEEGEESSRAAWTFPETTPLPFINFSSFDLSLDSLRQRTPGVKPWSPPSPPPETPATRAWSLTQASRPGLPRHIGTFRHASSSASYNRIPCSSPYYTFVEFKQWRRLGVVVWDSWRIYRLGLFEGLPRKPGEKVPLPKLGEEMGEGEEERFLPVISRDLDERARIPIVDYESRWLALVGVGLPCPRSWGYLGGRRVEVVP